MGELCSALGSVMGRPSLVPVPDFALRTLLGEVRLQRRGMQRHGSWAAARVEGGGGGYLLGSRQFRQLAGSAQPRLQRSVTRLYPPPDRRARRWCWRGSAWCPPVHRTLASSSSTRRWAEGVLHGLLGATASRRAGGCLRGVVQHWLLMWGRKAAVAAPAGCPANVR